MKASKVLIFILGVFLLLAAGWILYPAGGINIGTFNLRFASMEESLREAAEEKVDVDAVVNSLEKGFLRGSDTLSFYKDYFASNSARFYLPGDDYTFFDGVFSDWENARRKGITWRIVHYGDSQIEMDRISSDLRESLQERFGGEGTGMFPALGNVPSASIYKSASGGFVHYTMYGDSTTVRAPHRRYGVMAQLSSLSGGGTVSMRASSSRYAKPRTKKFSTVSVLLGKNSEGFSAKLVSDTIRPKATVLDRDTLGARLITWKLPHSVSKATISFKGNAEIYGVMADGRGGVAVDNIPLRGSSGTIFSRIDENVMTRSMSLDHTNLIILQFGGNMMPSVYNSKSISTYATSVRKQIAYFKKVAPRAKILFIGPSDMGKSVGGKIVTWPRLPEMIDSLRSAALDSGAAYWDLYSVMGGENSMVRWAKHSPAYAGPDYIHFTQKGAEIVGGALAKSILVYNDFYRMRKILPEAEVKKYMLQ